MTTTSCIQICQKSQEGTLRNFLHNSHFATQNSHNLKVAFWHGIFSGPSCFRILFLGCARRTKWTYIHKYSFSFGVGSDFQFLSEVAKSRILVWMSWYHDILLIKPARAVEVFNGWVLPQLKKWFPPLRKEGKHKQNIFPKPPGLGGSFKPPNLGKGKPYDYNDLMIPEPKQSTHKMLVPLGLLLFGQRIIFWESMLNFQGVPKNTLYHEFLKPEQLNWTIYTAFIASLCCMDAFHGMQHYKMGPYQS